MNRTGRTPGFRGVEVCEGVLGPVLGTDRAHRPDGRRNAAHRLRERVGLMSERGWDEDDRVYSEKTK
jgi:hypothetical protein